MPSQLILVIEHNVYMIIPPDRDQVLCVTQSEIRRLLEVEAVDVDVMTVDSGQTEGRSRISGESVETWILNTRD